MVKKVALVVVLLAAGVALAMYLRPGLRDAPDTFTPNTDASAEVRIADLERTLAAQVDRTRTLEGRLAALEGRRGEGVGARAGESAEQREQRIAQMREQRFGGDGTPPDPAAMRERVRERGLERLVAAGFTRERAEWLERRTEELEVQAMQAQQEAQRGGRPNPAQTDVQRALRAEIGDAEYERYLTGTGRSTQVQVNDVLASSAAEKAGLQAGDEIVSYAGTRVFEMRELNNLTREGSLGESVTVEVRRNGQTMQLQVPRGVLGIQGGGVGPRGGGGRQGGGPPGGFGR